MDGVDDSAIVLIFILVSCCTIGWFFRSLETIRMGDSLFWSGHLHLLASI